MRLLPRPPSASRRAPAGVPREPSVPGRAPAWLRRWRRQRRLLAALLAGLVVWSVTTTLRPPPPATRLVTTARHDLAPGATLTDDDLAVTTRPADSLADDAVTDPTALIGRVVSFPVHAGEPLVERDVVGRTLLRSLGADVVATPVRLSDEATLASVRPGDVLDVVAAHGGDGGTPASAVVVASRVRVLSVGSPSTSSDSGLLGSSSSTAAPVLVLATTTAQSLDIAAASVGSRLSVVLRAS